MRHSFAIMHCAALIVLCACVAKISAEKPNGLAAGSGVASGPDADLEDISIGKASHLMISRQVRSVDSPAVRASRGSGSWRSLAKADAARLGPHLPQNRETFIRAGEENVEPSPGEGVAIARRGLLASGLAIIGMPYAARADETMSAEGAIDKVIELRGPDLIQQLNTLKADTTAKAKETFGSAIEAYDALPEDNLVRKGIDASTSLVRKNIQVLDEGKKEVLKSWLDTIKWGRARLVDSQEQFKAGNYEEALSEMELASNRPSLSCLRKVREAQGDGCALNNLCDKYLVKVNGIFPRPTDEIVQVARQAGVAAKGLKSDLKTLTEALEDDKKDGLNEVYAAAIAKCDSFSESIQFLTGEDTPATEKLVQSSLHGTQRSPVFDGGLVSVLVLCSAAALSTTLIGVHRCHLRHLSCGDNGEKPFLSHESGLSHY